jgi:hypothetical protein
MTLRNKIILGCLLMAPWCVPLIGVCFYGLALLAIKYTLGAIMMASLFAAIAGGIILLGCLEGGS